MKFEISEGGGGRRRGLGLPGVERCELSQHGQNNNPEMAFHRYNMDWIGGAREWGGAGGGWAGAGQGEGISNLKFEI